MWHIYDNSLAVFSNHKRSKHSDLRARETDAQNIEGQHVVAVKSDMSSNLGRVLDRKFMDAAILNFSDGLIFYVY